MKHGAKLTHEFVEFIPAHLEEGTVYISITYAIVVHKCCCGCGNEVVTPLAPRDWKLSYDGDTVSLSPSIGNWSFPCQSHYWIRNNRVSWDRQWSSEEITAVRKRDRCRHEDESEVAASGTAILEIENPSIGLRERLKAWWSRWRR